MGGSPVLLVGIRILSEMETSIRIILALFICFIFILGINMVESEGAGCPEGMVNVPNSNICIEKINPSRVASFKEIAIHCLSKNLDICLAEEIIKACEEGLIKVSSDQGFTTFLTSSGMYLNMTPKCDISKTGPIGSSDKQQFLCCTELD